MTQSSSKLIFRERPADDPKQRKPDITLARAKLGWLPKIEIDEGLKRTIDYFAAHIQRMQFDPS
jgi:UDP-glucuronate decarboxylase